MHCPVKRTREELRHVDDAECPHNLKGPLGLADEELSVQITLPGCL